MDGKRTYLEDLVKLKAPLTLEQLDLVKQWLDDDWESHDLDREAVELIRLLLSTCQRVKSND